MADPQTPITQDQTQTIRAKTLTKPQEPATNGRQTERQPYHVQFPEALPHPATDRFLRINQVLEIIPVSRSTWWQKVKEGHYPRGVRLSPRTTAWRESSILALIERLSAEAEGKAQGAA